MNEIEKALSGLKRLELTLGNSIFRSQDDLTVSFLNKELEAVCIAQKALREKQERSYGCEWCEDEIMFDSEDMELELQHPLEDEPRMVYPNFCPMCGRSLKEGFHD